MTTVHISLGRDDGTDKTAAKGVVEWEPTARREDGTMVILPRGFTVPLVAGEASVTVDPSGLTWCWRVTERTDSGGTERYVSVPNSATTVEYVDLPDVDPTTLVAWTPADPEAAYLAALAGLDVAAAQGAKADTALQPATPQPINAQTGTTYTLVAGDAGKLVTCTNEAAITVTVPASTFTAGQRVDMAQRGDGSVTLVGGSGMTAVNPPTGLSLVSKGNKSYWTVLFISATEADVIGMMATP